MKTKTVKCKDGVKRSIPMTLHCSRCAFVTHQGIAALNAHARKKHPTAAKRSKARKRCPHCGR